MRTIHLESVDSTNEEAKRRLRAGELSTHSCIVAREQTAGRGSRGRKWSSPKDAGIYLSLVHRVGLDRADVQTVLGLTTLAAGVACVEALHRVVGIDVRLKPVNDLIAQGRKLGGILTEAMIENGRPEALIVGVGVNVRIAPRPTLPDALEPVCVQELVDPVRFGHGDVGELIGELADRIRGWVDLVLDGDVAAVREAWERYRIDGAAWPLGLGAT
ncbi:MAG: biotin--[acetyl-CoA-carboxylase] ligase [Planctomycetota bacterium]